MRSKMVLLPSTDLITVILTSPQDHVSFTKSRHLDCSSIVTKTRFSGHQFPSLNNVGVPCTMLFCREIGKCSCRKGSTDEYLVINYD